MALSVFLSLMTDSPSVQQDARPPGEGGFATGLLSLRWPVALVATAAILSLGLGRLLQQPIKIQLVMDDPLPVAGLVDVGGIRTPLLVEKIQAPIRTEPIVTKPIAANVTLVEGVKLASPLSVTVPQLTEDLGVAVRGPINATVGGRVNAQVAGKVEASVNGDVSALLRGQVDSNVNGKVDVSASEPLPLQRIKLGF